MSRLFVPAAVIIALAATVGATVGLALRPQSNPQQVQSPQGGGCGAGFVVGPQGGCLPVLPGCSTDAQNPISIAGVTWRVIGVGGEYPTPSAKATAGIYYDQGAGTQAAWRPLCP
jgi:hypothetical protein